MTNVTPIFSLHSDDTAKIAQATGWMKNVVNPFDPDEYDTYACLLYKTGKIDEAIKAEARLLQFCIDNRTKGTYTRMMHTTLAIQKMWSKDKIWEMKEFQ